MDKNRVITLQNEAEAAAAKALLSEGALLDATDDDVTNVELRTERFTIKGPGIYIVIICAMCVIALWLYLRAKQ